MFDVDEQPPAPSRRTGNRFKPAVESSSSDESFSDREGRLGQSGPTATRRRVAGRVPYRYSQNSTTAGRSLYTPAEDDMESPPRRNLRDQHRPLDSDDDRPVSNGLALQSARRRDT